MSIFNRASAPCPACGTVKTLDVVASVNADRRPDLRDAILAGTFQAETCESCGAVFKFPPQMTYIDHGRNQWILALPARKVIHWPAAEAAAGTAFDTSFGSAAPKIAQELGRTLTRRVVFGWPALREKLRCQDAGLDDLCLELLKCAVLANVDGSPFTDDLELRLLAVEADALTLAWLDRTTELPTQSLRVPRALYDDIVADADGWRILRARFEGHPFVDIARAVVPPALDPTEDAA